MSASASSGQEQTHSTEFDAFVTNKELQVSAVIQSQRQLTLALQELKREIETCLTDQSDVPQNNAVRIKADRLIERLERLNMVFKSIDQNLKDIEVGHAK